MSGMKIIRNTIIVFALSAVARRDQCVSGKGPG